MSRFSLFGVGIGISTLVVLLIGLFIGGRSASAPLQTIAQAEPNGKNPLAQATLIEQRSESLSADGPFTSLNTPRLASGSRLVPAQPEQPEPKPAYSKIATRSIGYVPILMYHYIREVSEAEDPLGFRLSVRPDRFAEQMAWLNQNGYTTLTMGELATCLRAEENCPRRPVALTFDDGYADVASEALPILKRYGFTATFYIVTGFVDQPGYLTRKQVRELHAAGMEIGSHTLSHAGLTGLSIAEARREIYWSKLILEEWLGSEVVSFSYPAGNYNAELAAIVQEVGYSNAVITLAADRPRALYELPRRRVMGGETIAGFPWYFIPASKQ
jgi:peptidoglycan/xylan/chitin deacetylase (PgdA/CDA1 family)